MVSTKMTVAIMVVMATCFVIAAQAVQKCPFKKDKLSEEDKKYISDCYHQATEKTLNQETFEYEELTADQRKNFRGCIAMRFRVFNPDGTINAEEVKRQISLMDISDETGKTLNDGLDSCVTAKGDGKANKECLCSVFAKACDN